MFNMLISTIEQLRAILPINRHLQFASVQPYLSIAQKEAQDQLTGEGVMDDVLTYLAAVPFVPNPDKDVLVLYLRQFVANKALFLALPHLRNQVSEMGVQQAYSDSGRMTRPATVEDTKQLSLSYAQQAYLAADQVLDYLSQHPNLYPNWSDSEQGQSVQECIIRNKKILSSYLHLVKSAQVYKMLKPYLMLVQRDVLKGLLCKDLLVDLLQYAYLKDTNADVSAYPVLYDELLRICRELLAFAGLEKALPFMDVVIVDGGLFLHSFQSGADHKRATDYRQIEALKIQCVNQSTATRNQLMEFLQENVNDLPLYANSTCWAVINPANKPYGELSDNESRKDFWL
jgi:hypothetical protein